MFSGGVLATLLPVFFMPPPKYKICKTCGNKNHPKAGLCAWCGSRLSSPTDWFSLAFILLIAMVLIGLLVYTQQSGVPSPSGTPLPEKADSAK